MLADDTGGVLGFYDRYDFEIGEIAPGQDPFLQQARIVALHELEATVEVRLDPAPDIDEPFGRHAASVAKARVDGLRIPILEMLDHHEEHVPLIFSLGGA